MIDTEALRKKVIDLAIQGKLTQQLPEDGNAEDLYTQIQKEKAKFIKEGKIKNQPTKGVTEDVPFDIPTNWKWVRVGDIEEINLGFTYRPEYVDEGVFFLSAKDITGGKVDFSEAKKVSFETYEKAAYGSKPHKGDILFCRVGTIGKPQVIYDDVDFCIFVSLGFFRDHFNLLIPEYIVQWMNSKLFERQVDIEVKGALQKNLNTGWLKEFLVPLPPYAEQKRIVEKLDELLSLIDTIDALQQQYESDCEVLKGKIIDAGIRGKLTEQLPENGDAEDLYAQIQKEKAKLIKEGKIKKEKALPEISDDEIPFEIPQNWKWVRLGNLGANVPNAFADGPFGSNLKREHYTSEKQVRIIQLSNVGIEGWKDDNEKYTTYEHLKSIQRSEVKAGDIVIAKMMPAGRSIVVPDISNAYVLSSDCVKFVPNSLLDTNYLRYAINSNIFHDQVLQDVHGIGRERTSLSNLKRYLLPIPPIEEQKRIVSIIEAMFIQLAK